MFEHPENYTPTDVEKFLKDKSITSMPDFLLDLFSSNTEKIKKNLSNKIDQVFKDDVNNKQYDQFLSLINDENLELTLSEQKFLNEILNQVTSLNSQGMDSTDVAQAGIKFVDKLKTIAPEIRDALLNQLLTNGFTKEGLQKTLDYIDSIDELSNFNTSDLQILMEDVISNISLSSQAVLSDFKDNWEDINKLFSSLYKGVDQKDIESIIQQAQNYGLTIREEDFLASGDKFIIDTTAIDTYLKDLSDHDTVAFDGMKSALEGAYEDMGVPFEDADTGKITFSTTDIKDYQIILGTSFKDWFDYNEELKEHTLKEGKTIDDLQEAVDEAYQNGILTIDNLYSFFSNVTKNINKMAKWSIGDYSSLLDTSAFTNLKNETPTIAFQKLTQRLYQLADINYDDWSIEELNEPDVKNAVKNIRNAYSSLISDVLDKGFDNIDLLEYDGLVGIDTDNLSGTYADFVITYVTRAGKTIDEINDLILQARAKDRETTSEDLIKDVIFVSEDVAHMSEDTLGNIANAFDKHIVELLRSGAVVFDSMLGEYVVNVEALKDQGIDLTAVDNFKLIVQESIDALFNSITSDISSALGGSLSVKNQKNLADNLAKFGIEMDLQFTRTKKGLKLSESSAIALYSELKKIDAIQSQLVFDELNKSLQETN